MGFTPILLIIYLVLLVINAFALINGIRNKKWLLFIIVTTIMITGICVLGYLWVISPM